MEAVLDELRGEISAAFSASFVRQVHVRLPDAQRSVPVQWGNCGFRDGAVGKIKVWAEHAFKILFIVCMNEFIELK